MSESVIFSVLAAAVVGLMVIARRLMRLRIAMFRFLRWNWLADWHERNFEGFVLGARIAMGIVAVVLVYLAVYGR